MVVSLTAIVIMPGFSSRLGPPSSVQSQILSSLWNQDEAALACNADCPVTASRFLEDSWTLLIWFCARGDTVTSLWLPCRGKSCFQLWQRGLGLHLLPCPQGDCKSSEGLPGRRHARGERKADCQYVLQPPPDNATNGLTQNQGSMHCTVLSSSLQLLKKGCFAFQISCACNQAVGQSPGAGADRQSRL